MELEKRSNLSLFLRTLTPSPSSLVVSFVIMLLIVGFHFLLLSNQPELFLPHVAGESSDSQLTTVYQSSVLGPLDNLFGSDFLGVASTALIWGFAGWIVYSLIDFGIASFKEWRTSDEDIAYVGKDRIIQRPMHQQTLVRLGLRAVIGVVAICGLFVFRPMFSFLFFHDVEFLRASSAVSMVYHATTVIIGWLLLMHFYVVMFRLFAFRTRVFGEIIR
ncbi:hypothetical protein KC968_00495 [Candidatus Saccharibacteria bacterium]|nr:hypothetical protein [Candidatus Saccharibacteria bacterium]